MPCTRPWQRAWCPVICVTNSLSLSLSPSHQFTEPHASSFSLSQIETEQLRSQHLMSTLSFWFRLFLFRVYIQHRISRVWMAAVPSFLTLTNLSALRSVDWLNDSTSCELWGQIRHSPGKCHFSTAWKPLTFFLKHVTTTTCITEDKWAQNAHTNTQREACFYQHNKACKETVPGITSQSTQLICSSEEPFIYSIPDGAVSMNHEGLTIKIKGAISIREYPW